MCDLDVIMHQAEVVRLSGDVCYGLEPPVYRVTNIEALYVVVSIRVVGFLTFKEKLTLHQAEVVVVKYPLIAHVPSNLW